MFFVSLTVDRTQARINVRSSCFVNRSDRPIPLTDARRDLTAIDPAARLKQRLDETERRDYSRDTREGSALEAERYIHLKPTTIFTTRRGKRHNALLPLTKRMLIK
jgi:hypothetical protein